MAALESTHEDAGSLPVVHPSQRLCGRGAPLDQQREGDDDVGAGRKEEEDEVGGLAPAGADNLARSVGAGSDVLEGDGEDAKENNPDGDAGGVSKERQHGSLHE